MPAVSSLYRIRSGSLATVAVGTDPTDAAREALLLNPEATLGQLIEITPLPSHDFDGEAYYMATSRLVGD